MDAFVKQEDKLCARLLADKLAQKQKDCVCYSRAATRLLGGNSRGYFCDNEHSHHPRARSRRVLRRLQGQGTRLRLAE
jgi:hypothetical protein